MSNEITYTILFIAIIIALLVINEFLYKKFDVKTETSRKIAHVLAGICSVIFLPLVGNSIIVIGLGIFFFLVLLFTRKIGMLDSVHKVDRKSVGSLIYPLPISFCYTISVYYNDPIYFYLPVLTYAISDPFAAIIGINFPIKPYQIRNHTKTWSGSVTFLITSFVICFEAFITFSVYPFYLIIVISIIISILTTFIEAISTKGYDNISIPVLQVFLLKFLIPLFNV